MAGQTILKHNTAFMDTAMNMWCAVVERNLVPINPSIPDSMKFSSKRHGTSDQYAAEYWKDRRRVEHVINAMRIGSSGEDRRFIKAIARQHIFDHMSCSVYFGDGGKVSGMSFVHMLKSRDGTFQTPQATFVGEANTRMAAASVLFFCYNGQSIPEALLIYANRTINRGLLEVSYRDLGSYADWLHHVWKEQGCTQEEMSQVPTRAQKSALCNWFNQGKFERARERIALALNSDAYRKIKNAVTTHERWSDAAFSGLNRVRLEYVYRPWRDPKILFNGASNYRMPCLAYPLSSDRMAIGIPDGTRLKIDGIPQHGVQVIRPGAVLERGAQQLWFVDGKLTTPAAN